MDSPNMHPSTVSRRAILGGLAAGAALPLIGAGRAPKRGGILRVAADFQPTSLDPRRRNARR